MPEALYPDDWYKGLVSFSDVLVKINAENLSASSFVLDPAGAGPDAVNLFLSEDEKTLFFMNRRDNSLWRVDLEQ